MLVKKLKRKFSRKERKLDELNTLTNELHILEDSLRMLENEKVKLDSLSSLEDSDVTLCSHFLNNRYEYVKSQIDLLSSKISMYKSELPS